MPDPALSLLACLAVAVAALSALRKVGRRFPIPPTCAACGYDVSHGPPDATRCSECGSDLKAPGAVRTTTRVRPWWVTATLGGAAVVALAGTVGVGRSTNWPWWWQRNEPLWLVKAQARHGWDAMRIAATDRWIAKASRGAALPFAAAESYPSAELLDHLLAIQADRSGPWRAEWGDAIVTAWRVGAATPEQFERYVAQMFADLQLRVSPRIWAGVGPVPLRVAWRGRTSKVTALTIRSEARVALDVEPDGAVGMVTSVFDARKPGHDWGHPWGKVARADDRARRREVHVRFSWQVIEAQWAGHLPASRRHEVTLSAPVEILVLDRAGSTPDPAGPALHR